MAVANILRAAILPPAQWNTNILNENLITGDKLYQAIRIHSVDIPASGYLLLKNFDVIKEAILAYNKKFVIQYNKNPPIFGSLQDNLNVDRLHSAGCSASPI